MSYQVIARKYRPQRFDDVVGQDHVTRTLVNAVRQNRIAHAYLFCGPRGTGKTTIARIFAKCLNCTGGPKVEFADDDPRCQEIADGRSLDVLEIDGASNRGIDEVRELRETVKYAPATSRFRIYIIDEVHMLTKEAFNALLKTLEEPPAHVKFMFATTEPEKVLPTILSRCQRFDLRRIPSALIVKHLDQIARQEGVKVEDAALHAIARGADGSMRDAESALDQLISFCGTQIVEEDVLSMFGLTARNQLLSLTSALLAAETESVLRHLKGLAESGKDLGRLISDLLNHFRNLLLYRICSGDCTLIEVSEAEADALRKQAPTVTNDALTRILEVLSNAESRVRDTASKRILLEVTLLKVIQARDAVNLDTVMKQLLFMRNEAAAASAQAGPPGASCIAPARPATVVLQAATTPAPETALETNDTTPKAAPPAPPASSVADGMNTEDLAQLWSRVLAAVGRVSPFTKAYLLEAHPVCFARGVLTIGFDPESADHLAVIDNPKNRTLIQTKLEELGYSNTQVRFIQAEAPSQYVRPGDSSAADTSLAPDSSASVAPVAPGPGAKSAATKPKASERGEKKDFKKDPVIKQALELFKGRIVDMPS
jgi:DNA polymerase-3 subunit gamma/tau